MTISEALTSVNRLVQSLLSAGPGEEDQEQNHKQEQQQEDRLAGLTIDIKITILKFLVVELMGTILVSEQIDARFGRLPEMEKQARRENVEGRTARKDLASVRREIRALLAAEENSEEPTTEQQHQQSAVVDIHEPVTPPAELETLAEMEPIERTEDESKRLEEECKTEATSPAPSVTPVPPVDNEARMKQLVDEERRLLQKIGRGNDHFGPSLDTSGVVIQDSVDSLNVAALAADSTTFHVHEEILKQRMSVRNRGVGRDRHGREYWSFQSLPGIFLYVDQFTMDGEHVDLDGVSVEPLQDLRHEWYRYSDAESIAGLMKSVDAIGMKFECERQLKKMLDKWRNVLLENELWTKCGDTYANADRSVPQKLRANMASLLEAAAKRIFMPIVHLPNVFTQHRDMVPGVRAWLDRVRSLGQHEEQPQQSQQEQQQQQGTLAEWKAVVLGLLSTAHRPMDGPVTTKKTKNKRKTKRKVSQGAPIPRSELSPLVLCCLDPQWVEIRPVTVKSMEKSLHQWKILVDSSDHMDRLYVAVRLLHDCIMANTETSVEFAAVTGVDPLTVNTADTVASSPNSMGSSEPEDMSQEEPDYNGRAKRNKTSARRSSGRR